MTDNLRVYVTKYALTRGIHIADVTYCSETMVIERIKYYPVYYHGDDWHYSREAAIAKAEAMRRNKIESLKKQIARLKKIDFEKSTPGTSDVVA